MPTRDCPNPRIQTFLASLAVDNPSVNTRPFAKRLDDNAYKKFNKLLNATKLPPLLAKQEKIFKDRREWPSSQHFVIFYKPAIMAYESAVEGTPYAKDFIEEYFSGEHPFEAGSEHNFDPESKRVRINLKKNGGCPHGETKGKALSEAIKYVNETIKSANDWNLCWSTISGLRTQPAPPGESKSRLIHMVSTADWVIGLEAVASALSNTDEKISPDKRIFLFHTEPELYKEWYSHWDSEVVQWVSLDWEQFDVTIEGAEEEAASNYFSPNYEFLDLRNNWLKYASIMHPWGTITPSGGKKSGDVGTNLFGSWENIEDLLEALEGLNLLRFVVCIGVNGDDIVIGFSTQITEANLEKINNRSRHTLNVGKVEYEHDGIWSNKLVIVDDICCTPFWRVWNNMKYEERSKTLPDEVSYQALQALTISSQLEKLVIQDYEHPCGIKILAIIDDLDKYHPSSIDDSELGPASEHLAGTWEWKGVSSGEEVLDYVKNTRYYKRDY